MTETSHLRYYSTVMVQIPGEEYLLTFTLMLVELTASPRPGAVSLFKKSSPYTFTVEMATDVLMKLKHEIIVEDVSVSTFISASRRTAKHILCHFARARLLTSLETNVDLLKPSTEFRPTAKGVSLLQRCCKRYLISSAGVQTLLTSLYNSMELVHLERDPASNDLVLSNGMAAVLWNIMLGDAPNVYDPSNPPSVVKTPLVSKVGAPDSDLEYYPLATPKTGISPYYHKYFTHPSSNAHSQYHCSSSVRFFKNLTFERANAKRNSARYQVDYVTTGKALWQWVIDCTDILLPEEAAAVVKLLISNGFLTRVEDDVIDCVTCEDDMPFEISRQTFYRLSERGFMISNWQMHDISDRSPTFGWQTPGRETGFRQAFPEAAVRAGSCASTSSGTGTSSPSSSSEWLWEATGIGARQVRAEWSHLMDMRILLKEPGMKLLLRSALHRTNSEESICFHDEYSRLFWMYTAWVSLRAAGQENAELQRQVLDSTSVCWNNVLRLSSRYLSNDSPYLLNIDARHQKALWPLLRQGDKLLHHPDSIDGTLEKAMHVLADVDVEVVQGMESFAKFHAEQLIQDRTPVRPFFVANVIRLAR